MPSLCCGGPTCYMEHSETQKKQQFEGDLLTLGSVSVGQESERALSREESADTHHFCSSSFP